MTFGGVFLGGHQCQRGVWHRAVRQGWNLLTIRARWLRATPKKLHRREGFPSASHVRAFPGTGTRPHSFKPPKTTVNKLGCWVGSELQESETVCFQGRKMGRKKKNLTIEASSWSSHPDPHPALQHLPDSLPTSSLQGQSFYPIIPKKPNKKSGKAWLNTVSKSCLFLCVCVCFFYFIIFYCSKGRNKRLLGECFH